MGHACSVDGTSWSQDDDVDPNSMPPIIHSESIESLSCRRWWLDRVSADGRCRPNLSCIRRPRVLGGVNTCGSRRHTRLCWCSDSLSPSLSTGTMVVRCWLAVSMVTASLCPDEGGVGSRSHFLRELSAAAAGLVIATGPFAMGGELREWLGRSPFLVALQAHRRGHAGGLTRDPITEVLFWGGMGPTSPPPSHVDATETVP